MEKNWFLLTLSGFILAFVVFRALYKLYTRCMSLSIFSRCNAKLDHTPIMPTSMLSKGKPSHHKKTRRTTCRKKRSSLTFTPEEEKAALQFANNRHSTPYAIDVSDTSTGDSTDPVSESSPERTGRLHHESHESRLGIPLVHRFMSRSLSRGRSSPEASSNSSSSGTHSDVEAQVLGPTPTDILSRKR